MARGTSMQNFLQDKDRGNAALSPALLLVFLFGMFLFESAGSSVRDAGHAWLLAAGWLLLGRRMLATATGQIVALGMVLLAGTQMLATATGYPWPVVLLNGLDFVAWSGALFLPIVVGVTLDHRQRRWLLQGIVILTLLLAVLYLPLHTHDSLVGTVRGWPLANPNHDGILFAVGAILSLAGMRNPGPTSLAIRFGTFLACGIITVLTGSVSALSGLVVVSLGWATSRTWGRLPLRRWIPALLLLPPVAVIILASWLPNAWRRVQIWRDVIGHVFDGSWGMLHGFGWQRFADLYPGWQSWQANRGQIVLAPESEMVMLLFATGILGILILAFVLWRLVRTGLLRPAFSRSLRWHAGAALWLIFWQASIDNTLHTLPMLTLTGTLLGIRLSGRNGNRSEASVPVPPEIRE